MSRQSHRSSFGEMASLALEYSCVLCCIAGSKQRIPTVITNFERLQVSFAVSNNGSEFLTKERIFAAQLLCLPAHPTCVSGKEFDPANFSHLLRQEVVTCCNAEEKSACGRGGERLL